MDNGKGEFKEIDEKKFNYQMKQMRPKAFSETEIVEIRGSRFRIEKIYKKKMILKLLPNLKKR